MKIRSVKPEFFTDVRMAELSPLARLLYMGLWCIADDAGRGRYLPKLIEGEVFPHDQVDIYALLKELLDTQRIVTYANGKETLFHIPTFDLHQHPNRTVASKLPAPPKQRARSVNAVHKQRVRSASAVQTQGERTADAPPVLVLGEVLGEVSIARKARAAPRSDETQTTQTGVWTALEDLFGEPAETERRLRGKLVRSLVNAGGTFTEVKNRAGAWPKLFPRGNGGPPLTLTATALEKWWGQLGLIVETGRPPPDCGICGNRRLVGVTAEGEIVSVEEDNVQVRQCSCVGTK